MLSATQKSGKAAFSRKQNGWLTVVLLAIAVGLGYLLAWQLEIGIGVFAGFVGLGVLIVCMVNTELGLYINILYSFLAFHLSREFFHDSFPVGVGSNALMIATFLGLFSKKYNIRESFAKFWQTPVPKILLINLAYIMIELFNPYAHSFEGWYGTARALLMDTMLLFVCYNVFTSYSIIRRFVIMLFVSTLLVAVYGCIQQWHGLFDFELSWVTLDPVRFNLIFIGGDFRKFSTLADPAGFAIVMSSCAAFFIVMLTGRWKFWQRMTLFTGVVFLVLGMAYSGTRTANAMLLGGLAMFIVLTINQKPTRIFVVVGAAVFLALLYGPFGSNQTVIRFRSTFQGTKDESYLVRTQNRHFIQPYIYYHPIGGGLGTTGAYGAQVNPGHPLAGFPTDSGYLRKALEIGWIGLFLVVLFYYSIIRAAIRGYFQCTNKRAKTLYAAATACMFSFYVAEFAQDAIGQITDMVVYYPMIGIILQLKNYEKEIT